MREAMNDAGEPDAVIQTTETGGEPGFLVRTTTTSAEDATARANQVAEALGMTASDFEVTTIGPDWGASVIQSSLIAFLVSILLIIVYIAIRFEYKMGVMAIVALFHDLILVVGIYALVGREVNPNPIAALLTILGYSLYDTCLLYTSTAKAGKWKIASSRASSSTCGRATCSWPTRRGSCRRACSAPSGARAGRPRCFCCASAEAPSRGRTAWPSGRCSCGRASA